MTFSFGREVVEAASVKYRLDMLRPIIRIWTIMTPVLRMLTSSISMLYGWACQQPLAIGGFRRLSEEEKTKFDVLRVPDYSNKGFLIEVSLSYPSYLHDDHNCFPLAPVKRNVADKELSPYAEKAWAELHGPKDQNRKNCFVHSRIKIDTCCIIEI